MRIEKTLDLKILKIEKIAIHIFFVSKNYQLNMFLLLIIRLLLLVIHMVDLLTETLHNFLCNMALNFDPQSPRNRLRHLRQTHNQNNQPHPRHTSGHGHRRGQQTHTCGIAHTPPPVYRPPSP